MSLGNRLLNLRKKEGLSQEEVADKLGVSRQTVSKWETDQSMPDFDKIVPLCKLYGISSDELLTGEVKEFSEDGEDGSDLIDSQQIIKKRAQYISAGVLFYFVAIAWFMITAPTSGMNPMIAIAGFLVICGVATYLLVYANMVYKARRSTAAVRGSRLQRRTISIVTLIMTCIYFVVSFTTFAWHITWILWIVNAIIIEIVRLVFALGGKDDEK